MNSEENKTGGVGILTEQVPWTGLEDQVDGDVPEAASVRQELGQGAGWGRKGEHMGPGRTSRLPREIRMRRSSDKDLDA